MSFCLDACTRVRIFLGSLALCSAHAFAASPDSLVNVDLEPHWQVGTHLDYVLTKTSVLTQAGTVKVNATNTTPVQIDVVAANSNGYVLAWTLGQTRFDDTTAASMNPLMVKMAAVTAGRRVLLRLDRHGRLLEVTNWLAIQQFGDTLADDISELLARSGASSGQVTAAAAQLRAKFASEEHVRDVATREAQLLLLPFGHRYERARATDFSATVPNPVGEGSVFVSEHIQLRRLDSLTTLEWYQTPANTRASDYSLPRVQGQAMIDLESGWPVAVTQKITAISGDAQRTDTTSLKRR